MSGSTKQPKKKAKTRTARETGQTRRDKNRRVRREELRLFLSRQKLISKNIDIAKKLMDMRRKIPPELVARLRAAATINSSLINKYLGDDKTLEMLNDEENPLVIRPVQYVEKKP